MLVSDMTAHYLTLNNNELHLCDNVGCLEKQQIQNNHILDYAVSEQPYPLAETPPPQPSCFKCL